MDNLQTGSLKELKIKANKPDIIANKQRIKSNEKVPWYREEITY